MEKLREVKVLIKKDTNKSTVEIDLNLGEYNENETIKEFIERVIQNLNNILVNYGL